MKASISLAGGRRWWRFPVLVAVLVSGLLLGRCVWFLDAEHDEVLRKQAMLQAVCLDFLRGSDLLTMHVQRFVTRDGRESDRDSYFKESREFCHREKGLQYAEKARKSVALRRLQEAMEVSLALMNKEYRAMRLLTDEDRLAMAPSEIRYFRLTDEEMCVTRDERRRRAFEEVFGDEYVACKRRIRGLVSEAMLPFASVDVVRQRRMRRVSALCCLLVGMLATAGVVVEVGRRS